MAFNEESYAKAKFRVIAETATIDDIILIKDVADSTTLDNTIVGEACGWYWNILKPQYKELADEYLQKGASLGDNYCLGYTKGSSDYLIKACNVQHPIALYDVGVNLMHQGFQGYAAYLCNASVQGHAKAKKLLLNLS